VRFAQRAGEKAALPKVAAPAVSVVQRQCILGMRAAQRSRQGALTLRHGNEVDVVCHETVTENTNSVVRGMSPQKLQVEATVIG